MSELTTNMRALTPCLLMRPCVVCEARLFSKSASPEKRAAKYAHQASWYGGLVRKALSVGLVEEAGAAAVVAAGYARLALDGPL